MEINNFEDSLRSLRFDESNFSEYIFSTLDMLWSSKWKLELSKKDLDHLSDAFEMVNNNLLIVINNSGTFDDECIKKFVHIFSSVVSSPPARGLTRSWGYGPYDGVQGGGGPVGGGFYPPVQADRWEPAVSAYPSDTGATSPAPAPPTASPTQPAVESARPAESKLSSEAVRLGVSAPRFARRGEQFTARFVAYLPLLEQQVREMLAGLSPRAKSHLGLKVSHNWVIGTAVTVRLRGEYITCEKDRQEFIWEGDMSLVDFDVQVQPTAPEGFTILKFDVDIGPFNVGNLRLDLEITNAAGSAVRQSADAAVARRAFASYASQDQSRVLDRVAAVAISAGLQVFLDCLSLHPGEAWKPRLESEIWSSDKFLLFWSPHAKDSVWVDWEWRTALKAKGLGCIQLHPLDTVKKAPPPDELKELHFGDVHMLARNQSRTAPDEGRGHAKKPKA